jgi:ATP:corrinoid adenosyltransferase
LTPRPAVGLSGASGQRRNPVQIQDGHATVTGSKIKHPMDAGRKGQQGIEW